jgi:beta-glucanase (GH16 family)
MLSRHGITRNRGPIGLSRGSVHRGVVLASVAVLLASASGCSGAGSTPVSVATSAPPSTSAPVATNTPPSTSAPGATGGIWHLVWNDEFNGPAGTLPDPAHWTYDLGSASGWGNQEWEYYTNDPSNVSMDGKGYLDITARKNDGSLGCYYGPCQYTSARLLTKNIYQFKYGLIEARIKVPAGIGLWPAFWMLGSDIDTHGWALCGEIDVMENLGRTPNKLYGTAHGPGYSGGSGLGGTVDTDQPLSDDYHVFAVEWQPDSIVWTLDGKPYFHVTSADVPAGDQWVFDHDFFILMNLAVGGGFAGLIDPALALPATMSVDYVRVYQLAG